jgi:acetyl esterase/lipase
MTLRRGLVFVLLLLWPLLPAANAGPSNLTPKFPNRLPGTIPAGPVAKPKWIDLAYATVSNAEKLDLYLPGAASVNPYPLVIYIHGGGWKGGDKLAPINNGLVSQILAKGYAVASLNYRLSGEAEFPAAVRDVKAAVRWLRANASQYNLDAARFGAWGDSAGGNLAAILGTSCGDSYLEGPQLGNSSESSCVQAVVDWFGPTDFLQMDAASAANGCPSNHDQPNSPESQYLGAPIQTIPGLAAKADPITYVTSNDPPFFIQHGKADCTVPYQQSQLLYDALQPVIGGKVTLMLLDGALHEDPQFFASSNVDLALAFLDQWLK